MGSVQSVSVAMRIPIGCCEHLHRLLASDSVADGTRATWVAAVPGTDSSKLYKEGARKVFRVAAATETADKADRPAAFPNSSSSSLSSVESRIESDAKETSSSRIIWSTLRTMFPRANSANKTTKMESLKLLQTHWNSLEKPINS